MIAAPTPEPLPKVCPTIVPGLESFYQDIMGYTLQTVAYTFFGALAVCLLLMVLGKAFHMRALSLAGGVGVLVVFGALLLYLILPGILRAMFGAGCW